MKKITAAFAFVASVFASGSALGAVQFLDYTGALPSNTIVLGSATITLSSQVVDAWYDVTPPTPQKRTAIAAGASAATGETFVASDINKIITSGNSYTYDPIGDSVFKHLALHIGAGTLLFEFQNAIASLSIATSGHPAGNTNVFGFVETPNAVPLPGAIWLLSTALLGFVALSRRKGMAAA
jgi:hypothetical protein